VTKPKLSDAGFYSRAWYKSLVASYDIRGEALQQSLSDLKGFLLLIITELLLHTRLSSLREMRDGPKQTAHYHIHGL
jgi:hypothetical protein